MNVRTARGLPTGGTSQLVRLIRQMNLGFKAYVIKLTLCADGD